MVKIYFIVPKLSFSYQEKKRKNPKKSAFMAVLAGFCSETSLLRALTRSGPKGLLRVLVAIWKKSEPRSFVAKTTIRYAKKPVILPGFVRGGLSGIGLHNSEMNSFPVDILPASPGSRGTGILRVSRAALEIRLCGLYPQKANYSFRGDGGAFLLLVSSFCDILRVC